MSIYLEYLRRLRRASCSIEGPDGVVPFDGPMSRLAHILLTSTVTPGLPRSEAAGGVDPGRVDNVLFTNETNPWSRTQEQVKTPTILYRTPVYQLTHPKELLTCASVFSETSKMSCGSFSLPAGPPNAGGSCKAARRSDLIARAAGGEDVYICRSCYAIRGNYMYPSAQLSQAVTLEWVKRLLAEDDGGATFARAMVLALIDYRAELPRGGFRKARDGKSISLRYFRIHDSGDLAWGREDYYRGWCRVAAEFEGEIDFWAPTRDYLDPAFAALVARVPRPRNFVLRPSAFHFQSAAPAPPRGFDAGSTSAYRVRDLPDPIETGLADYNCPAYDGETENHTCERVRGPDGKRPCRVCWTHPELTVNYRPHLTPLKKHLRALRGNPAPAGLSDDELTDFYRSTGEWQPLDE